MPFSRAFLPLLAITSLSLAGCLETDEEEVPDQPFEGVYGGECDFDIDGNLTTWAFELDAVYDEATAEVTGVVTVVDSQNNTQEGEIDGFVDGDTVDLNLFADGVNDAGNYSFDIDVYGEAVEWWYEGSCTTAGGDTGVLFLRSI